MTISTVENNNSVWNVFFNDKRYMDLVSKVNAFLTETENLFKAGYRLDVINDKQNDKIPELQNEFKSLAQKMLDEREQKLNEIEDKEALSENPSQEVIKRQDFTAKLQLSNNSEIIDMIARMVPEETSVYELNELQKVIEKQFNSSEKNAIAYKWQELKQAVLTPFANNEEYKKLEYEFDVIANTGMAQNGVVITTDEYGVVIKSVGERYADVCKAQAK